MGICASCLRGLNGHQDTEQQIGETAPLLNNERNYDKDAQLRKREEELNEIVNETNDKLIDISSFYNANTSLSELMLKKSTTTLRQDHDTADNAQITPVNGTDEQSQESSSDDAKIIEEDCKINKKGPLVIQFSPRS